MNKIVMPNSQLLRSCVWGVLCIAILAGGVGVMRFLIMNGPKASTAEPEGPEWEPWPGEVMVMASCFGPLCGNAQGRSQQKLTH